MTSKLYTPRIAEEIERQQEDSVSDMFKLDETTKFLGQMNKALYGINPFDPNDQRDNEQNV